MRWVMRSFWAVPLLLAAASGCAHRAALVPESRSERFELTALTSQHASVTLDRAGYLVVVEHRGGIRVVHADSVPSQAGAIQIPLRPARRSPASTPEYGGRRPCQTYLWWHTTSMGRPTHTRIGSCSTADFAGAPYRGNARTWLMVMTTSCPPLSDRVPELEEMRVYPADLEGAVVKALGADGSGCDTQTALAVR